VRRQPVDLVEIICGDLDQFNGLGLVAWPIVPRHPVGAEQSILRVVAAIVVHPKRLDQRAFVHETESFEHRRRRVIVRMERGMNSVKVRIVEQPGDHRGGSLGHDAASPMFAPKRVAELGRPTLPIGTERNVAKDLVGCGVGDHEPGPFTIDQTISLGAARNDLGGLLNRKRQRPRLPLCGGRVGAIANECFDIGRLKWPQSEPLGSYSFERKKTFVAHLTIESPIGSIA
jgi:hypothetical protein